MGLQDEGCPPRDGRRAQHSEGPGLAPSSPAPKNEMKAGVKAWGGEEDRALHSPDLRTG